MSWGHSPPPGGIFGRTGGTKQTYHTSEFAERVSLASKVGPAPFLAGFLDRIAGHSSPSAASGSLQSILNSSPELNLVQAFAKLDPKSQNKIRSHFSDREWGEILTLSHERDFVSFLDGWIHFGRRLKNAEKLEGAGLAFEQIFLSAADPRFAELYRGEIESRLNEARHEQEVLQGKGSFGRRMEFLGPRVLKEATDPWMLAGFGVAATVYQGTRLAALTRLAANPSAGFFSRGIGLRFASSGLALMAEAPAFVATTKLGHAASGQRQDWSPEAWRREILGTGLMLFFLKGAGSLSQSAAKGMPRWSPLISNAGMVSGIYASHLAEEALGWKARTTTSERLQDSLLTLFQFHVGGRLADHVFGGNLGRWQREWKLHGESQSNRPPAWDWLTARPRLAPATAALKGPRNPLDFGISLMEGSDDGGSFPKRPRFLTLTGDKTNPPSIGPGAAAPGSVPWTAEQMEREFELVTQTADQSREEILNRLEDLEAQLTAFLGHLVLERGTMSEVKKSAASLASQISTIQEKLETLPPLKSRLEALAFSARSDVENWAHLDQYRTWIQLMESKKGPLVQVLQKVERQLQEPGFRRLQSRIYALSQFNSVLRGNEPFMPGTSGQPLIDEIFFHRAAGILRAPLVKQVLRASREESYHSIQNGNSASLAADSPWVAEHEWMARLLYDLNEAPASSDVISLLFKPEGIPETSLVRQVLAQSGTHAEPFRAWLSVYLPVLAAAHGGDFQKLMKYLDPLHPVMDPELRTVTELGAWWLCQALKGRGDPRNWPMEFMNSQADAEAKEALADVLIRVSEKLEPEALHVWEAQGPLGALKLALFDFLHFPYGREAPIQLSAQAPAGIREETLSFTAALLGAFHGDGFFSHEFLGELINRRFSPGEREQERLKKKHSLNSVRARMDGTRSDWKNLWRKMSRADSQPPRLLQVAGPNAERVNIAFNQAFDEGRQTALRAVERLSKVLRQGVREGLSSEEILGIRETIGTYLDEIEAAVGKMKASPLSTLERSEGSRFQMIEQVQSSLFNLRTVLLTLDRLRQVEQGGRLTEDEAKVLFEQIAHLSVNFGLPSGAYLVFFFPHSFEHPEVRRLYDAVEPVGKSLPPPQVKAPLFERRSDWALVKAITEAHGEAAKLGNGAAPSLENLAEIYFRILGASVLRFPHQSLANQASPSALISVILPAYLWLNAARPEAAYRELRNPSPIANYRNREVWRGASFFALRLLEGAALDAGLIEEAREFFGESPLDSRLSALSSFLNLPEEARDSRFEEWERTRNSLDAVIIGLGAALLNPGAPENARETAERFSEKDPERIAVRVAGMMAGLSQPRSIRPRFISSSPEPSEPGPESARDAKVRFGTLKAHYNTVKTFLPEVLRTMVRLYQSALAEPLLGFSSRLNGEIQKAKAQLEMVERDLETLKDAKVNFLGKGEQFSQALKILLFVVDSFQKELREKGMTPDFAEKMKVKLDSAAHFLDPQGRYGLSTAVKRLADLPLIKMHPATARLDQVEGAVLGGAVADAFGAPFEFQTPEQIKERNWHFSDYLEKGNRPAGKWTDDTLFTLAALDSLLEDGAVVPRKMAQRFSEMGVHRKDRGFGMATKRAVRRLEKGADWKSSGDEDSASNGAAMRVAPVAIFSYRDLETMKRNVLLSSQITHAGYEAISGALGFAFILATILRGDFNEDTILKKTRLFIGPGRFSNSLSDVEKYLNQPALDPSEVIQQIGTSSLIWNSGASAVYAFLKYLGDYQKTIVTLAKAGGDADTMATLAGTLAGAYRGIDGIPPAWVEGVEKSVEIRKRAQQLHELVNPKKK